MFGGTPLSSLSSVSKAKQACMRLPQLSYCSAKHTKPETELGHSKSDARCIAHC